MTDDLSRGEYAGNAADTAASGTAQGGWSNPDVVVAQNDAAGNAPAQGQAANQAAQDQGGQGAPAAQDQAADAGAQQQAAPGAQANAAQVEAVQANAAALGGDIGPVATDGTVSVHRPGPGETVIYDIAQGEHINVQFDPDAAIFRIVGDDFILNFGDGGRLVLEGFVPAAQSGHPPQLDIGGQQVAADALVNQALAFNEGLQFPQTAAGPALLGGGGHNYSDDLGSLIGLLNPEGVIPPVNMGFGLIRLLPGGGLSEDNGTPGITITPETPTPPVVPTPNVPGGSTGNGEHPTPGPNGTVVFHGGGFEDAEPNQHVGDTSVHPTQLIVDFLPSGSEVLTSLTISGVPAGSTFMVGGTDAANVVTVTNGSVTLTADQVNSGLFIIPPHDADQDIPLTATAQFTNNGQAGTVTGTTTVIVDAVADKPHDLSATPDHSSVVEGHNVTFAVHASFGDFADGSESHSVLVELQQGWGNPQGYATETIPAGNIFGVPAGTYVIVPVANGGIAADGSVTVNVTLQAPGSVNAPTTFQFDVAGKAQETALSGSELTTDNNVSYTPSTTPAEVTVIKTPGGNITVTTETNTPPVTPTGDVPGGSTGNGQHPTPGPNGSVVFHGGGFEDAEPNQHIGDTSVHPIQIIPTFTPVGSEVLTSLTISGIPAGSTFMVGGTATGNVVAVTNGSVTLTPAQVASGLFMIPPHDADQDIPLNVSGQFREPSTGATGTVSATTTAVVDAVADKPHDVGGAADHPAVVEGQAVTFAVHATFGDFVDGSESHSVLVELQSGWGNPQGYATETIPAGNIFGVPAGTYVIVPVANSAIAADGTITANVTLTAPGSVQGVQTYELNVAGKAQETALSGGELTTDNNVSYTPSATPVEVKVVHPGATITVTTETTTPPIVPTGDVPGGSTGNGQTPTPGPNGTVVFHGGGFEDAEPNQHVGDTSIHPIQIIPTFTPVSGEVLTSLTISGIPSGATFLVGGTAPGNVVAATNGSVTLTPAQVASGLFMIPPHDADQDIPLNVTGQFREPLTGATGTVSGTTTAVVDAVADKPQDVTGTADNHDVSQGQSVSFAVHATFGDFADGSESHSVLVELQQGWGNPQGYATETIAAGNAFGVPAGTYVIVPVANSAIAADGSVTVNVTLTAPGNVHGTTTYELDVAAKAQETNLSGGELTTDNNVSYTPSATPVEVKVIDNVPLANPSKDAIYEAGLPNGTDPNSGHNVATGYFSTDFGADGPGGIVSLVSQSGVQITDTGARFVVNGGYFVMTVDKLTGDYVATLLDNTLQHTGVNLVNDQDVIPQVFTYTIADADGDTSTSTFTLNIADDGPAAYDDDASVKKGGTVTGNVMDNDEQGADSATVTQVNGQAVNATGDTVVQGTYGTLTIHADGSFSYVADHVNQAGTVTDRFTYRITDLEGAHGDSAQANLDIRIENNVPTGAEDAATVREAGINGHGVFSAGTDAASGSENASGTLHYSFGPDAAAQTGAFAWSTNVTAADGDANGRFTGLTSGGDAVQFRVEDGGHTIVGFVPSSASGPYAGQDVLKLTVTDTATGAFGYQQLGPIDHPDNAATVGGLGETEAQDPVNLTFNYTVKDADGDTAAGKLTVKVLDDGPIAKPDAFSVEEPVAKTYKLVYVVDVSNSMNETLADGSTKLDAAKTAFAALNQQAVQAGLGDAEVLLVAFNNGVQGVMQFSRASDPGLGTAIDQLVATNGTKYEPAFNVVSDWLGGRAIDPGIPGAANTTVQARAGGDVDSRVFFLSDGGNNNSAGGWDPTYGNVENLYGNVGNPANDLVNVTVKSVGFGIGQTDPAYQVLDLTDNNQADHSAQVVETNAGAAGIQGAFGQVLPEGTVTGNVLHNDQFGADGKVNGGGIVSIQIDNATYDAHTALGGHVVSNANGVLVVNTALGGQLTFNFNNGDFTYKAPSQVPGDKTEDFKYTIRDGDGDLARTDLKIDVLHQPPQAHDDQANVVAGEQKTGKLVYVVDTSHSMSDGLANGATRLDAAKTAFNALNQQAIAAGFAGSEVLVVAFNAGVQSLHQFARADDPAISSYISGLTAEGGTKYEPSLSVVSDWLAGRAIDSNIQGADTTTSATRNGHDYDSRVFFLTDGANNNSAGGWDPTHGRVEDLYSNVGAISGDLHNVTIRSVGFGLDHSSKFYGVLDQTDDNIRNGSAHTVDSTASAGQIQEGFGVVNAAQVVTGSVLQNDVTGNDAQAHVVGFSYNGVNYTADSAVGGAVISNANGMIEIHTAIGGDFQFNFATGQYTYHAPGADLATEAQEVFRYTLADSTGATSSANLTIHVEPSSNANGGFEYGNLIDWDAAGSAWVTDQDQHGDGHYSAVLGTNNSGPNTTPYSSDTLANFVGANASDLAHLTPQATGTGSVLKTTLNVDPNSGHQISLDFNFLTDEGSAGSTNDFAFVAINGKLHLLADAHNTSGTVAAVNTVDQGGFSRSTGWHSATFDVSQADSQSGHVTVAMGVMNAGINGAMGHDSALQIDNVHVAAQAHA